MKRKQWSCLSLLLGRTMRFAVGVAISLLMLSACVGPGISDWSYELPNGYEVWRVNSSEIVVVNSDHETIIPSFVKEFAYDKQYVLTRNVSSIQDNDILSEKYYVLDTANHILYDPFDNIDEFRAELEKLEICVECWYRTSPDPNMR